MILLTLLVSQPVNSVTKVKPDTEASTNYVSQLLPALTKKNKVVPMGGKRNKHKRNKKQKRDYTKLKIISKFTFSHQHHVILNV